MPLPDPSLMNLSLLLPHCGSTRGGGDVRFVARCERHGAPGTRFQLASFDERITPLAQSGNVHVDPVIPPIEGAGIVAEVGLFVGRERGAEAFDVGGFKDMIVVEDEGLEERDELDDFFEFAFLAG